MHHWTLLSNHGHVLLCLVRDCDIRLRDVATDVGITERAVQKIVRDLQDDGMVSITKKGRRNRYRIHNEKPLRHDLEANFKLSDLINMAKKDPEPGRLIAAEMKESEKSMSSRPKPFHSTDEPLPTSVSKPLITDPKADRLEPEKSESSKTELRRSIAADSKKQQQGSLF